MAEKDTKGKNIKHFFRVHNVMLCAIWYHIVQLKNVKNTQGGALLLVKLQVSACNITKSITPPLLFFLFL